MMDPLRERYNPDGSELRRAQLRMLEMLQFIDQVCRDHQIVYWLDSGTLLGAARHKGFIPWDDDVDICMPRADMKKFRKLMLENNPSHEFVVQCKASDPHYFGAWITLRDLKSEYLQQNPIHNIRKYRGLQIDIFPLEDVISPAVQKYCGKLNETLLTKFLMGETIGKPKLIMAHVFYGLLQGLLFPAIRWVSKLFPKKDFYIMSYGSCFKSRRYLKHIYPLRRIAFEGHEFNAPCDVDGYLTTLYGQWQQIPSADKIQTHQVEIAFK